MRGDFPDCTMTKILYGIPVTQSPSGPVQLPGSFFELRSVRAITTLGRHTGTADNILVSV